MSTFGQRLPTTLRDQIGALVDAALARQRGYPPDALADERALLVHVSSAMYAYYVGEDGAVYELDLDSVKGARTATGPSMIRETYEHAIAQHPELAALREVAIVEREAPDSALIGAFHEGVVVWMREREPREPAVARFAAYFARRMEEAGPRFVYLPMPSHEAYTTLHLVGDDPELELELHVAHAQQKVVEVLQRGPRAAIAAALRAPEFPSTFIALEATLLACARSAAARDVRRA